MAVLRAYYSGDTAAAVVPDESGNGFDAAMTHPAKAASVSGVPGDNGLVFDSVTAGADAYLDIPAAAFPAAGSWCLSFWASFELAKGLAAAYGMIYQQLYSATNDWLEYRDNYEWIRGSGGGADLFDETQPFLIVMEWEPGVFGQTWFNDMVTAAWQRTTPALEAYNVMRLGARIDGFTGYYWGGQIDEIAIWEGKLTEQERIDLLTMTPAQLVGGGVDPNPVPVAAPVQISTTYLITLTGTPDATTDIELPAVSVQGRLRSGAQSYLQAVLPNTSTISDAVTNRPNGEVVLTQRVTLSDGSTTDSEVNRVALETVQESRGVTNRSIVLTGHKQTTNGSPAARTTIASSVSTTSGKRTVIASGLDPAIQPADTLTADGETFVIDVISYQLAKNGSETITYTEA